jgi:hypothetical protein
MSGAGSAEEPGILQRHTQGCVEPSRGLEDPNLPVWAPTGVQLAPTSPKLVEEEFWEGDIASVLCYWLTLTKTDWLREPYEVVWVGKGT